MLASSFLLVYFIQPGYVPDDAIWKIDINDSMPEHIKVEMFMCALEKRENLLISNKNIVSEESLDESRSTSSNYLFNKTQHRLTQGTVFITT